MKNKIKKKAIENERKKMENEKKIDTNNYLVEKEITEEINYHQNPKIKTMEKSYQIKTEIKSNKKS